MCGRYVTPMDAAIERIFNPHPRALPGPFEQNFNTSPTQQVPILRTVRTREADQREVVLMRWGLVPYFAKGVAGPYATFNARIEGLKTAATFRSAWKRGQRCLVLVAGFYEWAGATAGLPEGRPALHHGD